MTDHAVLIPAAVVAKDVDAYVRPAISASAVDNGNVFTLSKSGVSDESFLATFPTSASAVRCWMAGEPEMPFAVAGSNEYRGFGRIQDFYNSASKTFTAFKLNVGDIIQLSADGLDSATASTYAVPTNGTGKFTWATAASTGLTLRYLRTVTVPQPNASAIGAGRITMFEFDVYQV